MADDKKSEGTKQSAEELAQRQADEVSEQGFFGAKVDPTPDENYSLQTPPDAPTPETDPELARKAEASRSRFPEER